MKHICVRRFLAYLIDILLIMCAMYFLSYIPLSRENQKNYEEISENIIELYDSYDQNEISEENFQEEYIPLYYELNRNNMGNTILNLFVIVLYFGCVPFFFRGQTVGKRMLKLRVVAMNEEHVGIVSYLVRAIILNNVFITIAQLSILSFCNAQNYYSIYSNVNLVGYVLLYFILLLMLVRADHRGLHDLIAGTKVVSLQAETELEPSKLEEIPQETVLKIKKTSKQSSTSSKGKKTTSNISKGKTSASSKTSSKSAKSEIVLPKKKSSSSNEVATSSKKVSLKTDTKTKSTKSKK